MKKLLLAIALLLVSHLNAADISRQVSAQSVTVGFHDNKAIVSGIKLHRVNGLFVIHLGDQIIPIQPCFVEEQIRAMNDATFARYLAAGGTLKIGRLPDGGYELAVGGGLKGGGLTFILVIKMTAINMLISQAQHVLEAVAGSNIATQVAGAIGRVCAMGELSEQVQPTKEAPGALETPSTDGTPDGLSTATPDDVAASAPGNGSDTLSSAAPNTMRNAQAAKEVYGVVGNTDDRYGDTKKKDGEN